MEQVETLYKTEKNLKAEIKKETAALQAKTKETIETLEDEAVLQLLKKKWIDTLVEKLSKLPDTIVNNLVAAISALQSKYDTTFFEIEQQIRETEQSLAKMIDELEGNDFDMKGLGEFKALLLGGENG